MSKYKARDAFQIVDPKDFFPLGTEGVVFVLVKPKAEHWLAKCIDYDRGHNCFEPELFDLGESGWFVWDSDIDECCVQIFDFENQIDILPPNLNDIL